MINRILLLVFFVAVLVYLGLPEPKFPSQPKNTYKSSEPADTETILRQAYYTNMSRQEIMDYYYNAFGGWGIKLVLPPEDAFSAIRDQTRSSYLEEMIHPFREALFVNAYVPLKPSEAINIGGVHYLNKVTVHYRPSSLITRLTVLVGSTLVGLWLIRSYKHV